MTAFRIVVVVVALAAGRVVADEPAFVFPPVERLPGRPLLPDPFLKPDGTRVAGRGEWAGQRAYLHALMEHYLYGTVPPRPRPDEVSVRLLKRDDYRLGGAKSPAVREEYELVLRRVGREFAFGFVVHRPADAKRLPVVVDNKRSHPFGPAEAIRRGYAYVEFDRDAVAPDEPANADRKRGIFPLYPDRDFAAIAAWAWAYQPVVLALDRLEIADPDKVVATGHSRGGQAAMAAGVFDERIAVVAPSTGGPWSVGSTRQRDPAGFRGTVDYAALVAREFPHWYHPRYREFAGRQNKQPWDAPTLVALIAPRPLLNLNSVADGVNNGLAHEVGIRSGILLYDWFDAAGLCRLHWRDVKNRFGQKGHDQGPEEFLALFDFADECLLKKSPGPSTFNSAPNSPTWRYDPKRYPLMKDWDVPGR